MATAENAGDKPRRPPATTPEARENQLIGQAYDYAEQLMDEGRAPAQVLSHFLKMGSQRESIERKKLSKEVELLQARIEDIQAQARIEELYQSAMDALRGYKGEVDVEVEDDY